MKEKKCKINKCNNSLFAKGYCRSHYEKNRKYGNPCYKKPLKLCSVLGCDKKHSAKGYCINHYQKFRHDNPENYFSGHKKCTISSCNKNPYATGLCRLHHNKKMKYGDPLYKRPQRLCGVAGCNEKHFSKNLCRLHYHRLKWGTNPLKPKGNGGSLNHRWNGGVAMYPNHTLMKKNRLIVLKRDNYKCFSCGKKATEIHHLDLSKNNHALENLVAACHKCNSQHRNPNIRYKDIYGKYAKEIRELLGISNNHIRYLHDNNKLTDCLKSK